MAENTGFQKNPRDLWVAARMTRQITGFLPSRGGRMEKKPEKTKFSIRVDTELVELADAYIRDGTVLNRTELIGDALRFYLEMCIRDRRSPWPAGHRTSCIK